MEWSKHRALRPVNVEPYQPGRRVVVDGTANDPDLWAALLDLHDYTEQQLRACMDLFARHRDPRHTLDLAPVVRWNVKAQGFTPVQLRFEFDRTRMFEILSDEIYQGDAYVFLRELLQNSIDAIRVRRAKQALRPQDGVADGVIEFKVVHGKDGDATVTCRDNGIGMDEYILRNYFAVAGVSYYRSADFAREGLDIDPISRFGIGILSCFMAADSIEVTTYRDPRFYPASQPLRLVVPAIDKQFRVFPEAPDSAVGTQVVVNVRGSKLKKAFVQSRYEETTTCSRLRVTDYLAEIAGFVEFPILVEEDEQRTVIVHPDVKPDEVRQLCGNALVRQLSPNFPWEEFILPQDLHDAKDLLKVKTLDIKADLALALEGFEGWVSFVVPKDSKADFPMSRENLELPSGDGETTIVRRIEQDERNTNDVRHLSRSCRHQPDLAVYQNGVLVPLKSDFDGDYYRDYNIGRVPLPGPRRRVSLKLQSSGRPDISRYSLVAVGQPWETLLRERLVERLWEMEIQGAQNLRACERFVAIGRFAAIHKLAREDFLPTSLSKLLPIPFLDEDGSIGFFEKLEDCGEEIATSPSPVGNWFESHVEILLRPVRRHPMRLKAWRGARCLLVPAMLDSSATLCFAFSLAYSALKSAFYRSQTRFLTAPRRGGAPLVQEVWNKGTINRNKNIDDLLIELTAAASPISADKLMGVEDSHAIPSLLKKASTFGSPYDRCFAYGSQLHNLSHPTTQALIRCGVALNQARHRQAFSADVIGQFSDILEEAFHYLDGRYYFSWDDLNEKLCAVWEMGRKLGVNQVTAHPPQPLSVDDFVPGTVENVGNQFDLLDNEDDEPFPAKPQPFGAVLRELPATRCTPKCRAQ